MWRWRGRHHSSGSADKSTSWRVVESPRRSRPERVTNQQHPVYAGAGTPHNVDGSKTKRATSKSTKTRESGPKATSWRACSGEGQTGQQSSNVQRQSALVPSKHRHHEKRRASGGAATTPSTAVDVPLSPQTHTAEREPIVSCPENELVVMTWNLMRDFKHYNSKNPAFAWESREPRIIKVIQDANPSILTLQECIDLPGQPIITFLNKLKGLGYEFDVFMDTQGNNAKQLRVVTLWKPSLYRHTSKTLWLSPDYHSSHPAVEWGQTVARPVGVSCFLHPYGDRPLWVFNVHLGHSELEKSASCHALVQMVADTCAASTQQAFVVMGDFNVFESSDMYNLRGIMTDNDTCPMTDLAIEARTILGDLPSPGTFVSSSIDSQQLHPGQCGDRLDHVFGRHVSLSGFARVWNKTMLPEEPPFLVLKDQFPSDHLPLVLRLNC